MSTAAGFCLALLVLLVLARIGAAERRLADRITRRLDIACAVTTVTLVSLLATRVLTEFG